MGQQWVKGVEFSDISRAAFYIEDSLPTDSESTDHVPRLTVGAGNTFDNVPHQAALAGPQATLEYADGVDKLDTILVAATNPGHRPGEEDSKGNIREVANASINAGIAAAAEGGTVDVEPGVFEESVVIDRPISLRGPFAGTHGNDAARGADEAFIAPDNPATVAVSLRSADVVLDGFSFADRSGRVIRSNGSGRDDIQVINNRFLRVAPGSAHSAFQFEPGSGSGSSGLQVRGNLFADIAGTALQLFKGSRDAVVENNDFVNVSGTSIQVNGGSGSVSGTRIVENRVSSTGGSNGIVVTNAADTFVSKNDVSGISTALFVSDALQGLEASCNRFLGENNGFSGSNFFGATPSTGVRFFHNHFTGNVSNNTGVPLTIGSNWYGGSAAPAGTANLFVADALPANPIGDPDCGNNAPVEIVAWSGNGQSAAVDTAFGDALSARVQDVLGGAVMGESATFSTPASGASASLDNAAGTTNYNGEFAVAATANSVAGSYDVTAESGGFSADFALTNTQGTATIDVTDTQPTYDGGAKQVGISTMPAGLEGDVQVDYVQSGTIVASCDATNTGCGPNEAGSYDVSASLVGNANYAGSGSGTLTIQRASTSIVFDSTSFVYDGTSDHVATAHLEDEPSTSCTVSGVIGPDAGSYPIEAAACTGDNYEAASAQSSATITQAEATVTLAGLVQSHDGTPKSVLASTDPAGLDVDVTYDGSASAPVDVGSYQVEATVADANYTGSASATLQIVADIGLRLQGPLVGEVGQPLQYKGTLFADPLPDSSEKFLVEVHISRDGGKLTPADIEKMEISFNNQWIDPVADLEMDIPWIEDGDDLVYLFPQPVMNDGFSIDHPEWSWDFRFTFAEADLYTATATVLDAASIEPVSSSESVMTDVKEPDADIWLQLQGAVEAETGTPVHYVGTLFADPLPDPADLFFVEVRVSRDGGSVTPSDMEKMEIFWNDQWIDPVDDLGLTLPWIPDGDDLVYLFPQPAPGFENGFPIEGSEWSWKFRFTWATADVFAATATVVDADTEEAVSSPVTVFTDIRERSPVTAGILFDPESLNHVYDGSPHAAEAETDPAGLSLDFSYNGSLDEPVNAGSYLVVATVDDDLHVGSATAVLNIDKAEGTIFYDSLSGSYGSPHAVVAALDEDAGAICAVSGVPAQDAAVGSYSISAHCEGDNHIASDVATYEVTASSVALWPVDAAEVGVVTIDPQPDSASKMSYYSWDSAGSADELVRAEFVIGSGNASPQANDLEAEWHDPDSNTWQPLPMDFDSDTGTWSQIFGPETGFEPGLGASDFRIVYRRGGSYIIEASLVGADSDLVLARSEPVATDVAEITVEATANAAGKVGSPVESTMMHTNIGTAALSSGKQGVGDEEVDEQDAPNDENLRARIIVHWDGGNLTPADPNGPGGNGSNCGVVTCASPDFEVEFYDADQGGYRNIYNLRAADDGGLFGYLGAKANDGWALSPGKSISNLFRLTALQHTGTYEVLWQVVGIETDTVYAQGPVQTIGVDDGEAAFIYVVEGDGGQAVAGGHDYSQGDLVVEVRNIHGNPVPGATVAFNVLPGADGAGATLSTPAVTDAGGQTSVAATPNDLAGVFEVSAELSNGAALDQPFVLENLADDDADQVEISLHTGDGQTAQVGTDYGLPLAAQVTDRFGNPLEGIDVSFADSGAGVTLASTSASTDADGLVDTGTVTASTSAGAVTVSAAVDASQCTSAYCSADFSLENTAGGAASVDVSAAQSSAVVGTSDAYALTVTATDANGNPVPGVSVSLVGPGSGAGVEPAIHAGLTDAAGELIYSFDANTTAGAFEVQAVASGVATASVGLENLAGDAAAIEQVSGSDQSAPVNSAFAEDLVVRVVDQYGNAVADDAAAEVSFGAPGSGPSASVDATATSSTDGLASTPATANGEAGSYSVVASLDSTDVSFALTNTTGEVEISDIVWTASGSDSVEWDGTAKEAQAAVSGTSLEPAFTYNGSTTAPSDAGSYQVIASIDDGNVQGSATAMLTITPREIGNTDIEIVGGAYTYDGFSHPATVSNPDGVGYELGYNTPDGQAPVDAGSWTATLEVTDPNYASKTLTATIEIGKVEPQLYLFDLEHDADGTVKFATVIVLPEALHDDVVVTYDPDTPRAAGSYEVTAVIEGHPNAEHASVSGTLVIHRESPCAIFCDRFEAVDDGLINLLPDRGTTQIRTTWSIPVPDSGRQQVVLELLNGSGREVAWIDTATTGQQQWLRLRFAGAGGEQRSDWLPWHTGAELGMAWGVNGNDDLVLRFVDGKGQPAGLELVVVKDSLLPHSVRQPGGH